MAEPVLAIDGLTVALPAGADRALALQGIALAVTAGQTLCVVGESGSGKSVLAMAVMGLLPRELRPTGGSIRLQGESLLAASPQRLRALRGRAMGMVFQEPMTALNPVMRCGEQIEELLTTHTNWSASRRRAEMLRVLARVHLPEPERMVRSFPHQLSGGQRQRIVIAMAVILKPALLLCDEPTTALDVTTQKEVLGLIAELQAEQRMAVLFITHDMGVVAEIADEVMVMREGVAVESGQRDEVLQRPRAEYTRMLLAAVPGSTPPPPRPAPEGRAIVRALAVAKTYVSRNWLGQAHETHALQNAALALHAGETIGVVGESGSGKSTLARCLIRLIEPSAGYVHWGDDEVSQLPESRLRPLRSRVQVVFQDPNRSLNPRRKAGDSIVEGAINFGATPEAARQLAATLMDQVRLPREGLQRYPAQFSGGQRQRLAIARALACRPAALVADEAVSALDVSVQAQIMQLLRDIQQQLGLGLLFITHDLRVAAQLCDRIVVMHEGRIVEEGPTGRVYARPEHDYTRRLLGAAPAAMTRKGPS
jgi:peptide/nickel transport system ATP-binding protein